MGFGQKNLDRVEFGHREFGHKKKIYKNFDEWNLGRENLGTKKKYINFDEWNLGTENLGTKKNIFRGVEFGHRDFGQKEKNIKILTSGIWAYK